MTIAEKAAQVIEKGWRGIWPADARRMALDLKRAGVLIPDTPDVAYGLVIDANGTRRDEVSCSPLRTHVALLTMDGTDAARVLLTPAECRELAGWLLAAAAHITKEAPDA